MSRSNIKKLITGYVQKYCVLNFYYMMPQYIYILLSVDTWYYFRHPDI